MMTKFIVKDMKQYKANDAVTLTDETGAEFSATVSRICCSHARRIRDYEVKFNGQNLYFSSLTGKQKHAKKGSRVYTLK